MYCWRIYQLKGVAAISMSQPFFIGSNLAHSLNIVYIYQRSFSLSVHQSPSVSLSFNFCGTRDHFHTDSVVPSSDHWCTETVLPSSDHCCIDIVVPSGDHCYAETAPPSIEHH